MSDPIVFSFKNIMIAISPGKLAVLVVMGLVIAVAAVLCVWHFWARG